MIGVLLEGLQENSRFGTNRLSDAIANNPAKDLRTTHPHRAITIGNRLLS